MINNMQEMTESKKKTFLPWVKVFKSVSMWAVLFGLMGHGWFYYFINISLPKFMNDIHDMPISENGIFQVVPWVSLSLAIIIITPVANDYQLTDRWSKRTIQIVYLSLGKNNFLEMSNNNYNQNN